MERKRQVFSEMGFFDKKNHSLYTNKTLLTEKKIKELCLNYVGVSYRTPKFITVFTRDCHETIFLLVTQFRYMQQTSKKVLKFSTDITLGVT